MMTRGLALAIALAGCGRLGFEAVPGPAGAGDDATGGDQVTLVVTSDEYLSEPAGRPVAGATVLIERTGATDRMVTDAAGSAQFGAAGALACHVIFKSDVGWRGYTVALPSGGAAAGERIELGSRPAFNPSHSITFDLPASANASGFTVRLPEHCASPPVASSPSVSVSFDAACDGLSVHALGFALGTAGSPPDQYVDAGLVMLTNGATRTMPGSYLALPVRTLLLSNLPAASDSATAEILVREGLDVTSLTPTPDSQLTSGNTGVTLHMGIAPGGNAIQVTAFSVTPVQYSTSSARIATAMVASAGPAGTYDARGMLPLFDSLALTDPTRVAWTGGAGGTITIVERNAGGVQWDWYLPADATVAQLPAIPADLGVPAARLPDYAEVVKLDVPGTTGAELLPTIDRRWSLWPHDPLLFPQAGSSSSKIFYAAALGPP